VVLQQSVTAGKTAAGTKVEAKLRVATLVDGRVVPKNAVFSGEVVESTAKNGKQPCRVSVRMDSIRWKDGSATVKVYVTAWYYPEKDEQGQELQYGPPQSPKRTWNGQGQYPNPDSPAYKPFPGSEDKNKESSVPDTQASHTSNHRVLMKDVETTSGGDGTLALSSKRTNLKLDKLTTYVLASGDLLPPK